MESGWSHFQLREYDPVIGRWLVPDPYRQFASPYVGIGNNPIAYVDPDGGCVDGKGKSIPCPNGIPEAGNEKTVILPEHVEIGQKPLVDRSLPQSLKTRYDFVEGHMDFSVKSKIGIVNNNDNFISGFSSNLSALELFKFGWKMDHVEGQGSQGGYSRYIMKNNEVVHSTGVRVEGMVDAKASTETIYNTTGVVSHKTNFGSGAPFVEGKVVFEHSNKHGRSGSIVVGTQEEWSKSLGPFSLTFGYNVSLQFRTSY